MKKKILSIVLALVLIFSVSVAYATEVPDLPDGVLSDDILPDGMELTSEDSIEDITETPLVSVLNTNNNNNTDGNQVLADEIVELSDMTINGNLLVFAKTANLKNITVNGDVAVFAEYITVSNVNVVNGATVMACQNLKINGLATEGNVYVAAQEVDATVMARDFYVAAEEVNMSNESQVSNLYNLSDVLPEDEVEEVAVETTVDIIKSKVYDIVAIVVKTALVCGFIFLCTTEFINKTKTENPAKYLGFSALKGLGWAVLLPIISIILLCTEIAAGVGIATFVLYIIIFWASVPVVAIAIMNIIAKPEDTKWKKYGITLCIAFLIAVVGNIPAIGGLVTVLVGLAGMGIVIGTLLPVKKEKVEVKSEVVEVKEEKAEEVKEDKNSEDNK